MPSLREVTQARSNLWSKPAVVVTNTDLDGLLSAAYMCARFDLPFGGFCNPSGLWLLPGVRLTDPLLFLENDVTHPALRAIGQHFMPDANLQRPEHLNINWAAGITVYAAKYPLAMINYLMWATGASVQDIGAAARDVLIFADSTWSNAIDYQPNMERWLTSRMPDDGLRVLVQAATQEPLTYQARVSTSFLSECHLPVGQRKGRLTQQVGMSARRFGDWLPAAGRVLDWIDRRIGWRLLAQRDTRAYRLVLALERHDAGPGLLRRLPRPFSCALPSARLGNVSFVQAIGIADQSDAVQVGIEVQ